MRFHGLDHVGVRVADVERAKRFYVDVLGLQPRPERPNWLGLDQGFPVHLMQSTTNEPRAAMEPARHFALRVDRLEDVVALLLAHGLRPFQATADQKQHRDLTSPDDALDFGIGTVFVEDPDGNVVEFVQHGRGVFEGVG
ncbi:MAG TPA: VOC family protein [Xanthobacteraceae bacterium]|jgi:catechol 2,3-dioxygenase-like lactoylglutathione lyase family enzyme